MASIENRGAGTWRITVQMGLDASGRQRRIRKTVHVNPRHTINSQRQEVEKIAAELSADAGRGLVSDARRVTMNELFNLFLDAKRETLAVSTVNNYQWLYDSKIRDALGNVAVQELNPRRLQRFFSDLSKQSAGTRSRTGKLSGTTRKHYHTLLKNLFGFAVKLQIIAVSPMDAVEAPPNDSAETRFYEPADLARLLACLESEPLIWRTFYTLAIYTGCRPGELVGLDWSDIDGSTITISAGAVRKDGHTRRTSKPKTKASQRKIDIPDVCVDLLSFWSIEQATYKQQFGEGWTTDAVFTTADGRRMDISSPTQRFQKILKKYDLPKITLYGLRHSHASALIAAGLDVRTVAGRLGHSQTSTTLDIYSHQFERANSIATQAITQAIDNAREITPNDRI